MSLYVGHLSPHVRREDLERVFRRFGRCSVQLKDGYGFAVYEATANAERALRVLRGKIVCGEQISLDWSNRQPRPFQRPTRAARFYEPYHRRNYREKDDGAGIRVSQEGRDVSTGTTHGSAHNQGAYHSDDALEKEAGHIHGDKNNIRGEKGVSPKEGVIGDGGGTTDVNPMENDRWCEPGNDSLAGHGMENGNDFDRYEPYHGYSSRDETENVQMTSSYGSPDHRSSQSKRRRQHRSDDIGRNIDKLKPQLACFSCGQFGHIMRNCPQRNAQQEKFNKFKHRRDEFYFRDKGDGRLKSFRASSWGRADASRDPLTSRHHRRDGRELASEKAKRAARNRESLIERMEKQRHKHDRDSQAKKRKLEDGSPKKMLKKNKARRSHSSSRSSGSSTTSSRSHSRSVRSISVTSSHSRSRSTSSRSPSASSSTRTASRRSSTKSLSSRSRSRSRSRLSIPGSQSLSVSPERKPIASPDEKPMNNSLNPYPKDNVDNVANTESERLENTGLNGISSVYDDENASIPFKMDDGTIEEHPELDLDDGRYSACRAEHNESESHTPLHKNVTVTSEDRVQNLQVAASAKLSRQGSVKCQASSSMRITTQEMFLALRHYGLAAPEERESGISVEEYFGAARLWPWEMIYYRRLKKGPISTENYARRLEQNREFGIVDKYIRSSSGWGEYKQDDT